MSTNLRWPEFVFIFNIFWIVDFLWHRLQSLTVVDSQAIFDFRVCKLSEFFSSSFGTDFTLRRTLFFWFLTHILAIFCIFEVWWRPKCIGIWFMGQNMPNRNMLRNKSSSFIIHSFSRPFGMHIFIWIQWRNPNDSTSGERYQ